MGMGTGGIPTTDNIPETTEIFGCPTDNILDNRSYILKQSVNQNLRYIYVRLYRDFKLFINIFDFDLITKTTLL